MAKRRAPPRRSGPPGGRGSAAPAGPSNPFEAVRVKNRFEVLGRKVPGTQGGARKGAPPAAAASGKRGVGRGIGRALTGGGDVEFCGSRVQAGAAAERVERALLATRRAQARGNAFVDRRFGESDPTLTEEDRALLRLQKQRAKELRALEEVDGDAPLGRPEKLTHGGAALDETGYLASGAAFGDDEDEDEPDFGRKIMGAWSFGGGKKAGESDGDEGDGDEGAEARPERPKSHKEIMEEIIAKSKAYKAERQRQREEDLDETDALDKQLKELKQTGVLAGMMAPRGGLPATKPLAPLGDAAAAGRRAPTRDPLAFASSEADAFDALQATLRSAARGGVSDRTKSEAELEAEREAAEAEASQAAKRRMRAKPGEEAAAAAAGAGEAGSDDDADLGRGGFAARRARRKREEREARREARERGELSSGDSDDSDGSDGEASSDDEDEYSRAFKKLKTKGISGDDLGEEDWVAGSGGEGSDGDDEDGSGDEGGANGAAKPVRQLTKLELRRQQRALGSHPLQSSFRDAALRLLAKHDEKSAEKVQKARAKKGVDVDEDESGSDEDESGSESGSEEESGSESGSEEESGSESGSEEESGSESGSEEESGSEAEPEEPKSASAKKAAGASAPVEPASAAIKTAVKLVLTKTPAAAAPAAPAKISPTALPSSYEAFAAQVSDLSPEGLAAHLDRLRALHEPELRSERRHGAQVLLGCIAAHLVVLGNGAPVDVATSARRHASQNALVAQLCSLAQLAPFYAATLARARLQRIAAASREAVATGDEQALKRAWPRPGELALLAALLELFPAEDRRHVVATPLQMLLGEIMERAPLVTPRNVASALFCACLAMRGARAAGRWNPAPLRVAARVLNEVGGVRSDAKDAAESGQALPPWRSGPFAARKKAAAGPIVPLSVRELLAPSAAPGSPAERDLFPVPSLVAAACAVLEGGAKAIGDCDGAPEALAPALEAAEAAAAACGDLPGLGGAAARAGQAARLLRETIDGVRARRKPMTQARRLAPEARRTFNPRFEDDFVPGHDMDPDRERAERKRMQRELRREERKAARETRRDAAAMAAVRDRERRATQAGLLASERRAKSFLQQQQADFKSGGQSGMWKKRKSK